MVQPGPERKKHPQAITYTIIIPPSGWGLQWTSQHDLGMTPTSDGPGGHWVLLLHPPQAEILRSFCIQLDDWLEVLGR